MNGARVAVIGVGHALLGDDAIGVVVVHALEREYVIPPALTIVDAGSCGLDLSCYLLDHDGAIFVDALVDDAPAGTVRTLQGTELLGARPAGPRFAPHQPAIHDALALAEFVGRGPRDALLIGIGAGSMEVSTELSAAVRSAVPSALDAIVGELSRRFGIELARRKASRAMPGWPVTTPNRTENV